MILFLANNCDVQHNTFLGMTPHDTLSANYLWISQILWVEQLSRVCQVDLPNGPWRPLTPASTSFAPNPLYPTTKTILQLHPRLSAKSLPFITGQHLGQSAVSLGQGLVNFGETWSRLGQTCGRQHASGFWLWRWILPSTRRQWRRLAGYQDLELCSKWQIRPAAPTAAQRRFYLDKTQRENIVGCWDKTVAWVLAKHGLAFGKTQLWPT